jgi:hypothetical protein
MSRTFTFAIGLVVALVFAGATVSALSGTFLTVKDAIEAEGSLEKFESHLRHYSDRWVIDETGMYTIRSPHPFAYHFGMIALCWIVTIGSFAVIRYLVRVGGERDPRGPGAQPGA